MKQKLLFLIASIFLSVNAWGQYVGDKFSSDGIYYQITSVSPATVKVTSKPSGKYSGSIIIPANISYLETSYSVTAIATLAFSGCTGLTSINIPESVTTIGFETFSYCNSLTSIIIPKSVTTFDICNFLNCRSLASIVIPESVTTLGYGVFAGCDSLISITIPESVTFIGDSAFSWCSSLTFVTIPKSVVHIGELSFSACSNLTSIIIPESVEKIDNAAFAGCENLVSLYCASSNPSIAKFQTFEYFNKSNCSLYIPKGSLAAYSADTTWQGFKEIVELDILTKTDFYSLLPRYTDGLVHDSAGIYTVSVGSNTEWTASSDQPWLTVTQSTLSGPGTISISALPNTTGAPRTATITVRTAGTTDNISVTLKSSATDGVITITVVQPAMTVTAEPEIAAEPACIFPNPAKEGFSISTSEPCTVDICTQSGAPVKSIALASAGTFRVDGMLAGMYFVTVRTATASQSHKLLVE